MSNDIPIFLLHGIKDDKSCTCGVLNCSKPGKHPYSKINWKVVATTDKKFCYSIEQKISKLNLAAATGRINRANEKFLTVIDIDDSNSHMLKILLNKSKQTFCYKTGGGYHFWFWSKKPIKNSVSLIEKNVDIRGTNGYVVTPPSTHVSGKKYELLNESTCDIQDLPNEIETLLNIKKNHEKRIVVPKAEVPDLLKIWNQYNIKEIREMINNSSILIPEGTRNHTIFRLLCSDRAHGANKSELFRKSHVYRKCCENYPTLQIEELNLIVESVMKYPAYDNSHENVNVKYVNWIEKNGISKESFLKHKLQTLDDNFFSSLTKGTDYTSLQTISLTREEYFKANGLEQYSVYKPSALGSKLRSLGFERIKTAKCNLWNVNIETFQENTGSYQRIR